MSAERSAAALSGDEWDQRSRLLRDAQASIVECKPDDMNRPSLHYLLEHIYTTHGVRSVMVEGGASVITAFLRASPSLVDVLVLTIAPVLVGGLRSVQDRLTPIAHGCYPRLSNPKVVMLGDDIVVYGSF
mmetsp:Transcript_34521/g.55845  ORF Transcript_34521/g.55845 Transcript_34521/m.55845 type:complete len:130 (+) Transcript_34521:467-856(+)